MEEYLIKFGLKTGHFISGFVAGIVGIIFNKDDTRSKFRKWSIVCFGAICTGYLTPLVIKKWDWLLDVEYSVAFVVGLFGMGLIESVFVIINKLKNDPLSVIERLRKIWKG